MSLPGRNKHSDLYLRYILRRICLLFTILWAVVAFDSGERTEKLVDGGIICSKEPQKGLEPEHVVIKTLSLHLFVLGLVHT